VGRQVFESRVINYQCGDTCLFLNALDLLVVVVVGSERSANSFVEHECGVENEAGRQTEEHHNKAPVALHPPDYPFFALAQETHVGLLKLMRSLAVAPQSELRTTNDNGRLIR
jgi:hypothetical protein